MLRQATTPTAQTNEPVAIAAIYQSLLAGTALAIVDDWPDHYSIANLPMIRNTLSQLLNDAAELMSERQRYTLASDRMRLGWTQIRAAHVLVEICPTYPAPCWHYFDLPSATFRFWNWFEAQVFLAMEAHCLHLCVCFWCRPMLDLVRQVAILSGCCSCCWI